VIYAKAYLFTLIVFVAFDFMWLGIVARRFYSSQLGSLMRDDIDFAAAFGFYLAYVAGVVFFRRCPSLGRRALAAGGSQWRFARAISLRDIRHD